MTKQEIVSSLSQITININNVEVKGKVNYTIMANTIEQLEQIINTILKDIKEENKNTDSK